MNGFTIDTARTDDIPALQLLLAALFSIETDFRVDGGLQRRGLALLIENGERAVVLVARDASGVAIAVASAQLVISTAEGASSAWVEDVIVGDDHRGMGVGRALLAALLDWARDHGATRAQLLADRTNEKALDFYHRLGWQPTRLNAWHIDLRK